MRSLAFLGALVLSLGASAHAAQVYKWVDAQGITHFGAQPPEGQAAQPINTQAAPPAPAVEPVPADLDEKEAPSQQEIDEKVKQQVAQQEAEIRRYCETLRTNLAQLQNNPRVRVEENGEVRRLGEEERQARIAETTEKIAKDCA